MAGDSLLDDRSVLHSIAAERSFYVGSAKTHVFAEPDDQQAGGVVVICEVRSRLKRKLFLYQYPKVVRCAAALPPT